MNGNANSTVLSGHANQRNLSDMTLTELQEIAMRQQQQIEINQQLLHAKEKRLKSLKQEDTKQYQMITQQQQQQQQQQPQTQSTKDMQKLEALKQSVLSQELKIFKLKQLRNQILEYKLSNANMYSELDLIKSLFDQKERELFGAISKVAELSKQIEQLRKLKQKNNHQNLNSSQQDQQQAMSAASSHITELERLKQELQIRNKLNEQQAKKIIAQQDQFNKKQIEVLALDKRIDELKERIAAKRNYLAATNNQQQQHIQAPPQPPPHAQIPHPHPYHHYPNQNVPPNNLASNVRALHTPAFDSAPQQLPQQQQQQQSQSPSKLVAKFATKQEIANTYMNKYNSDAYQKYQARMFQQQQQQQQQQHSPSSAQHSPQVADQQQQHIKPSIEEVLGETGAAQSSSYSAQSSSMSISSNVNGTAPTTANTARPESSSSSLVSLSPISNASNNLAAAQQQAVAVKGCRKASYDAPSQSQLAFMMANNAKLEDSSTLPSHLKLEFDKIKYLPDVVKTIKKRHSISEIESSNTLPPQIFQKILEKHHKNFLDQHGSLTDQMLVAPSHSSSNSTIAQASKLNKITEVSETAAPSSPQQPAQQQSSPPPQQQQQPNQQVKLSTFMPQTKQPQVQTQQQQNQQTTQIQPTEQIEVIESTTIKSTKSIIKTTPSSTQLSTDATESNTITASRRVNFDPHALLLDAAVEGELELVMRCAKQVRDISQPNDEGITALHNSVCAGHFGIVKFLVEYGCDINYADNDGWTPLHCAASCNNLQMIRFLIENGASLFATTLSDNETAIRKCEEDEEGFQPCYEYLAQAQEQLGTDGGFVYSLYDYEAQNEDELTFTCNQRLVVVDKCEGEDDANDGWWLCRLDNGQEGLVPKNYLGLYPRVRPGCESRAQEESTIC